jgi:cytochrome c biogenesis protein
MANGSQFCNSGVLAYDSFTPGLSVDGTQLAPFCVRVNGFQATYLPNGQAESFHANVDYQAGGGLASDHWQPYKLQVNSPLRIVGDRVYLLGHGYAPQFTVTFPGGAQRTGLVQWKPMDATTFLSEGATKFDPPGVTDPAQRRSHQLAITGLFAPTAALQGTLLSSSYPALNDPQVAVDVLRGDLGLDRGQGQSIFAVDQTMIDSGRLQRVARQNLKLGQEIKLDDGTVVHFDGVQQWVSLQVSHDPTQLWVLAFSVLVIAGLGVSLRIKRRRLWLRATPESGATGAGRTVVELAGLARTDQAGYGEEFTKLAQDLLAVPSGVVREPVGLEAGGSGRGM